MKPPLCDWDWTPNTVANSYCFAGFVECPGYGVIRPCRTGYKIGPLFADSPELAESLFLALTSKVQATEPIFLDTPEVNQAAVALAERHAMQVSFETARMYTGDFPELPVNRLFGMTSFEIG